MSEVYQEKDKSFVDYELGFPEGGDVALRNGGVRSYYGYGTYVGAAQTFGRFVKYPYPTLLEQTVGIHSLNMGIAGAGPQLFLSKPWAIKAINQGQFCVLQMMSGRSVSNPIFHYVDNEWRGTSTLFNAELGKTQWAEEAWQWYLDTYSEAEVLELVKLTQKNYVLEYQDLIEKIRVPVILLWFSTRSPSFQPTAHAGVDGLLGSFPQLVDTSMKEEIAGLCDQYVEVVTNVGLPQELYHAFTLESLNRTPGDINSVSNKNDYYPSPEMHWTCASTLSPVIKRVLREGRGSQ